jgi:hypothetical protein
VPISAAKELFAQAGPPNLFMKIPGTKEGLPANEEAIFAGIPINVTFLFEHERYVAAAEAFLRGIERRIEAGPKMTPKQMVAARSAGYVLMQLINCERLPRDDLAHKIAHRDNPIELALL